MTVVQPAVDAPTPKRAVVSTGIGNVEVHELQLGGLLDVIAEFDSLSIDTIPSVSVVDVLTEQQREQYHATPVDRRAKFLEDAHKALTPAQRDKLNELGKQFFSDLLKLLAGSRYLFLAAVKAFTDLEHEQAEKLPALDAMRVLTAALDTIDLEATVSAVMGFSTRLGGLMENIGNQAKEANSNGAADKRKSTRGTRGASS